MKKYLLVALLCGCAIPDPGDIDLSGCMEDCWMAQENCMNEAEAQFNKNKADAAVDVSEANNEIYRAAARACARTMGLCVVECVKEAEEVIKE